MRRISLVLIAVFCMVSQLWSMIFAPHYSSRVQFLDYNFAFKSGESVLTIIDFDGNTVKEVLVRVELVEENGSRITRISWKRNIPPGMIFLARNDKDVSRLPPHIAGTNLAIINLLDVDKSERKSEAQERQTTYVMCIVSVYEVASPSRKKKVVLVDLQYLYGVKKIYLNHSLVSVAARLLKMGHQAQLVDLNIDDYKDAYVQRTLDESDVIGVSLLGAPYIPNAIEFAEKIQNDFPDKIIAFGGQVVEHISRDAFVEIFHREQNVKQIVDDGDFAELIGEDVKNIPSPLEVSCRSVWEQIEPERLCTYLQHEMTLDVSRGCIYNCKFCAARKNQREQFGNLRLFREDIEFLAGKAKEFEIQHLEFYASALDFFQTPREIGKRLAVLARTQEKTGTQIKVRALTSMSTFLSARKVLDRLIKAKTDEDLLEFVDFSDLLCRNVYCLGFGFDGSEEVWKREGKRHNKMWQEQKCIDICNALGIRTELLNVMGFPEDNPRTILRNIKSLFRYALNNRNVVLRPYLAKTFIPGNEGWSSEIEKVIAADPMKFYNLDYGAIGSRLTHPNRLNRWISNFAYLSVIGLLYPLGKCDTLPLLPQGEKGLYGAAAKLFNRIMPSDR